MLLSLVVVTPISVGGNYALMLETYSPVPCAWMVQLLGCIEFVTNGRMKTNGLIPRELGLPHGRDPLPLE
jgi:hypothetical protein